MRVPLSWLAEYVPLAMPLDELATRLSIASAEVEGIETRGVVDADGNLGRFLVGRVLEAVKHPNADRLQLTRVDVGEGDARSIVCGAWNFGAGATVAVALPGAVLPNGVTLERRKVRGELSDGMILAEDEVDLGSDHTGIMLLPDGTEPGTPLADVLPLHESIMLIESTGNRPDLLSVYGIAREVAALFDLPLAPQPGSGPIELPAAPVEIQIDDLGGCPRYIGRLFEHVGIASSPVWLKARLLAAGMRPISNVVDVTNYVMLALGNPLHAFDYTTLRGGRIVVRRAHAGERLRTLDGVDRELVPADLMIADADRSVALAGIMGGEETEIGEATETVLLESANFEPHGLFSSERLPSSRGLEPLGEGVDPYLAEPAANLATSLVLELTGATLTAHTDAHAQLPARPVIADRPERADHLVGPLRAIGDHRPGRQLRVGIRVGGQGRPGQLEHERGRQVRGRLGEVRIDALLPAVRALGAKTEPLAGREEAVRLEVRRLEQHRLGRFADLRLLSAHDPRERHRAIGVGDHQVGRHELAVDAVEGAEPLSGVGTPYDDAPAAERRVVERVQRVAEREHHVVRDVDDIRDRAHAGREQARLQPHRRRGDADVLEEASDVAASAQIVDLDLDGAAGSSIGPDPGWGASGRSNKAATSRAIP